MEAKSLRTLGSELKAFWGRFSDCFEYQAAGYLTHSVSGQLSDLARKSVEPMALRAGVPGCRGAGVPGCRGAGMPVRSLQEFLTHLTWDERRVRDRVQEIVAAEHSAEHTAGVTIGLIDETSFVKKGTKTPGVQRQGCGHR